MTPSSLIDTADTLLNAHTRRPRQSDLKRAVSTIYYAMFHALCRNSADCLVGTAGADRSGSAWRQIYRAVEHGLARSQCENKNVVQRFPGEIQAFAKNFVEIQEKRHEADYDPDSEYRLADVQMWLDSAKLYIKRLEGASIKDRRAFAVWVTVKNR
ncbi:MAG: hypothetical protein OXF42_05970 [Candidatus Dadabacteria bacterium]|nr:hypothetical protein [Candidatus Dadabacteria bacterium]